MKRKLVGLNKERSVASLKGLLLICIFLNCPVLAESIWFPGSDTISFRERCMEIGGQAPYILNFGIVWRRVVSFTLLYLYPGLTSRGARWMGFRVVLGVMITQWQISYSNLESSSRSSGIYVCLPKGDRSVKLITHFYILPSWHGA